MKYFEESNSSLNRSFLESHQSEGIKPYSLWFKGLGIGIAAVGNSTYVVLPMLVCEELYATTEKNIRHPLLINCWRLQCVTVGFAILALIRRIFGLDDYFRKERGTRVVKNTFLAGVSLAIWTSGVMYGSQLDNVFSSYLFGYSFSIIIIVISIFAGTNILQTTQDSKANKEYSDPDDEEQEGQKLNDDDNSEESKDDAEVKKGQPVSNGPIKEKIGVLFFILGALVLILSNYLITDGNSGNKSDKMIGNGISFLSAFFGIVFHWVYAHYSIRHLYRIVEFLLLMYFFAALFLTIIGAIFIDSSEYKMMSLIGWTYFGNTKYSWLVCLAVMGGICGIGINVSRLVKSERYISPK